MENENKNTAQNSQNKNNKNKLHKHKAYFISPADEQSKNASSPVEKADGSVKTANANNNSNGGSQNNSGHKKKHKHKKPQGSPANTQQEQSAVSEASKTAVAQNQQQNKNQQKNNKPKHNNNNNNKSHNQSAPQSPSSQSNSQKNSNLENDFPKIDRLEKPAPKKLEAFSASPEYEKYKDYEEFTYEELYGKESSESDEILTKDSYEAPKPEEKSPIEVVGIKFKASGKTYYFAPNGITLHVGNHAVVETARGLEFGEVVMSNTFISEDEIVPPLRPIVRLASNEDIAHNEEIKKNEEIAFKVCNEKIIAHGLDMKLIDAQYTFDNTKLLFYFTSSGRVDFRELVKDLASVFRTRIELRQIGIRDEAKMIGGLGMCGRPLCCSIFLTDFGQVSIKMAKEQNLSLNSAKISGICGRLMCCLRYEHESYEYEIKRTPPVDTMVRTVDGIGTVTETSPLQGTIRVRLVSAPEAPPKTYKREEVTILKKKS